MKLIKSPAPARYTTFIILLKIIFFFTHSTYIMADSCNAHNTGPCSTGCEFICQKNCLPPCTTDQELLALSPSNAPCHSESNICSTTGCPQNCLPKCSGVHSIFIPRSQGADTARELVGWQSMLYGYNAINYFAMNQVLQYSRSYKPEHISRYLFNRVNTLNFTGSELEDRGPCDLLADYFGLAHDFRGSLDLEPRIQNIYFDNQFFFSLESIACGLWARANLPIVNTRWDLGLCEKIYDKGSNFPQCYMSGNQVSSCSNLHQALNGTCKFGNVIEPLKYGRFSFETLTLTKLADIDFLLGYNIFQQPYYHLGLYGQLVIPTGNKPNPTYIFSPIVGNAHHWELGIGLTAHRLLYNFDPCTSLSVYLEGNLTHMFSNTQIRSFDLCDQGPLSRYMLLKEFEPDNTFTGRFIPAINITTRPVDVSIDIKADFTLKFVYHDPCGLEADFGYNFFVRSAEDLKLCNNNIKNTDNYSYGIKGTEGICYLAYSTENMPPNVSFNELIATPSLNATQNDARITQGGTTDNPETPDLPSGSNIGVTWNSVNQGSINSEGVIRAQKSTPPVLLPRNPLRLSSGAACGSLTHSVFAYIGYLREDFICKGWISNIGIGAKAEFMGDIANNREIINGCVFEPQIIDQFSSSLNQWSVFVKGGISF